MTQFFKRLRNAAPCRALCLHRRIGSGLLRGPCVSPAQLICRTCRTQDFFLCEYMCCRQRQHMDFLSWQHAEDAPSERSSSSSANDYTSEKPVVNNQKRMPCVRTKRVAPYFAMHLAMSRCNEATTGVLQPCPRGKVAAPSCGVCHAQLATSHNLSRVG
jgi:hypothetical protein